MRGKVDILSECQRRACVKFSIIRECIRKAVFLFSQVFLAVNSPSNVFSWLSPVKAPVKSKLLAKNATLRKVRALCTRVELGKTANFTRASGSSLIGARIRSRSAGWNACHARKYMTSMTFFIYHRVSTASYKARKSHQRYRGIPFSLNSNGRADSSGETSLKSFGEIYRTWRRMQVLHMFLGNVEAKRQLRKILEIAPSGSSQRSFNRIDFSRSKEETRTMLEVSKALRKVKRNQIYNSEPRMKGLKKT